MSEIQRPVLIRARAVRDVRRLAIMGALVAVAGCASTGATLHSHHYRLILPPGWQVVEAGSGALPAVVRAPSEGAAPAVDIHVYAWTVDGPPADASGNVLQRLSGLASARPDDDDPCPERASQFFVLGRPARALHLVDTNGGHVVVTGGESDGSLVGLVGALAPGASGCDGAKQLDAIIERLAASLSGTGDRTSPRPPATIGPGSVYVPPVQLPEP